jgi:hypothetical protein
MTMKRLAALVPKLAFVLGLATAFPGMAVAYDCANAPDDIRRLRAEKDSTTARALNGITAILPIGIVVHSVEGNEQQSLNEMNTDKHNEQLDARISQIQTECKLKMN